MPLSSWHFARTPEKQEKLMEFTKAGQSDGPFVTLGRAFAEFFRVSILTTATFAVTDGP
jgi:hypothetical protein